MKFPLTLDGRALTHAGLGDGDAADRDFRESVAACPENAWVYYNQALVYYQQGEPTKAVVCFRLALALDNPRLPPRKRDRALAFIRGWTDQMEAAGDVHGNAVHVPRPKDR